MTGFSKPTKSTDSTDVQLTTLMMPLQSDDHLLVPNISMAELAGNEASTEGALEGDPDWISGYLMWRGQRVPVVRWETLLGQAPLVDSDNRRFAVMNSLYDDYQGEFYALVIQGIPQSLRVASDELVVVAEAPSPEVLYTVSTDRGEATVPNLQWLEETLGSHAVGMPVQ
ncbi:MAG: chemotaxis protein CheW [Natronospirillum sp.]